MQNPAAASNGADRFLLHLQPGASVLVNGREAVFLYARRDAAMIRYAGERLTRAVALRKVRICETVSG